MNINRIKNETLHKLTAKEIGALDLVNHGVMTYRGILKTRVRGFKTVKVSDWETHFVGENRRAEFIAIVSDVDGETNYAMRIWDESKGYSEDLLPLAGLHFLK